MAVNLQEQQQQFGMTKMDKEVLEAMVLDANNDKISSNLLKVVVEKLLPFIFEKYGPKIIDALIDAIEKASRRAAARQVFTGRAGRATAATTAQAAESTGNVLRELTGAGQESENALAR